MKSLIVIKGRGVGKSTMFGHIKTWGSRGVADSIRYPAGQLKPLPRALANVLALWRDSPSCAGSCKQGRSACNCKR